MRRQNGKNKINVYISPRALTAINCELFRFPEVETGGLLLGYSYGNSINIVEATDGGIGNVTRLANSFEYDPEYQSHLCSVVSMMYFPPLKVVGIWHKHNTVSTFKDNPFSASDDIMNLQIATLYPHQCLTMLFEKTQNVSTCRTCYALQVFSINKHIHSKSPVYADISRHLTYLCPGKLKDVSALSRMSRKKLKIKKKKL